MEHVVSPDGTRIAFERTGEGPPLVLVHGSINDHNIWSAVLPAFAERFTVYAMDRRGRGESGAPAEHDMQRQYEDVAAIIDAAGEPVDLIGHSFGAHCVLGATEIRPDRIKHLVLYEPPPLDDVRDATGHAFESDDASEAVFGFLRDNVGMPSEQLEAVRSTPFWAYLTSFAPTMPSEARALIAHGFDASRYASPTRPALLLQGSQTPDRLGAAMRQLAEYMPRAEWCMFEGQGHGAMLTAPDRFSQVVLEFLSR